MALLTKEKFEGTLIKNHFRPTGEYSIDGRTRKWLKGDGEIVLITVKDQYPSEYLDWMIDEYVGTIPLYNSNV